MLALVFPGQGSQKRGMGKDLFDQIAEFTTVESEVDQLLGYSLRNLCVNDPENRLRETQYTQPSLYVVNALHYYKARAQGETARFTAGHSLGEYNALLAAGVFDFMTGLRLVKERGRIMSLAPRGGMAAVIGISAERISNVIRDNGLSSLDVANFNSRSQTVVAGPLHDIKDAAAIFERAGARMYMPLAVSAPFHSRYMAEAGREFADFLQPFKFDQPRCSVMSNVTGAQYPAHSTSDMIKSYLVKQITHSVQWVRSIQGLITAGVSSFREIGPGEVLSRLIQQIQQEAAPDAKQA